MDRGIQSWHLRERAETSPVEELARERPGQTIDNGQHGPMTSLIASSCSSPAPARALRLPPTTPWGFLTTNFLPLFSLTSPSFPLRNAQLQPILSCTIPQYSLALSFFSTPRYLASLVLATPDTNCWLKLRPQLHTNPPPSL
jgi:hypothetical protein